MKFRNHETVRYWVKYKDKIFESNDPEVIKRQFKAYLRDTTKMSFMEISQEYNLKIRNCLKREKL